MKTAATAQHLADMLRAASFEALAVRAEANEFHDFLSPHAAPQLMLDKELVKVITGFNIKPSEREAAHNIRQRLHDGEFDASKEESAEIAESPEGQNALRRLAKGE